MPRQTHRHTIYDALDARGEFDLNPANSYARSKDGTILFTGPVEYPKMLYHPTGEFKIVDPGEKVRTSWGEIEVYNQKSEMKSLLVANRTEEREARALGWHDHPAMAIGAGGGIAPDMGAQGRIDSLEREIEKLRAERDEQEKFKTLMVSGSKGGPTLKSSASSGV